MHFVTKTSTHPGDGGTVPAGTLHWHSLPRVPTAVTSTQTIRDGSTVLHHNIFILNCDFPEGSLFQRANPTTYSQVTPPVICSPAGSTTQLTHVLNIHPLALGVATMWPSSLLSRLLPIISSGSHLAIPARKPLRVCPKTHVSVGDCSQLPDRSTWCSCAASARTV